MGRRFAFFMRIGQRWVCVAMPSDRIETLQQECMDLYGYAPRGRDIFRPFVPSNGRTYRIFRVS